MRQDLLARDQKGQVKVIEPSLLAKMSANFTVVEAKLYAYAMSKLFAKGIGQEINSLDAAALISNIAITIPLSEYQEFMDKTRREAYEDIVRISETMFHRYFDIRVEELPIDLGLSLTKGKLLFHPVRLVAYDAESGDIKVRFTPEFTYIYSLLGGKGLAYYSYEIENIRKLRTVYSINLFRYLYSMLYRGQVIRVSVVDSSKADSLDRLFNITSKYPAYKDKKRYVLQPAIAEINDKTILAVSFEEIREGRGVKWVEFTVTRTDGKPKVSS